MKKSQEPKFTRGAKRFQKTFLATLIYIYIYIYTDGECSEMIMHILPVRAGLPHLSHYANNLAFHIKLPDVTRGAITDLFMGIVDHAVLEGQTHRENIGNFRRAIHYVYHRRLVIIHTMFSCPEYRYYSYRRPWHPYAENMYYMPKTYVHKRHGNSVLITNTNNSMLNLICNEWHSV